MILRHEATYQGYPCKAVQYRRSPGLLPETGFVEIDMQFARKIDVRPRFIPWRGVNGFEFPGQTDPLTWSLTRGRATVTLPAGVEAESPGFEYFGNLVLKSFNDQTGGLVDTITYRDVMLEQSGIEEVTRQLAEVKSHDRGTIRVPITDIRRWYNHGAFFGAMNLKLKSGEIDSFSSKNGRGQAWTALEAFEYLFFQLPGSPIISSQSEVRKIKLANLGPLVGEGRPIVDVLQKLLNTYGLVAGMLPDGNYVVSLRNSSKFGPGQVPTAGGGVGAAPQEEHYERRSVHVTDRPAAVIVYGPRRIRRVTLSYVPILQDADGRWYRVEDLVKLWGYSMDKVNKQAFVGHEKNFEDVPPPPTDVGSALLHQRRKRSLRNVYRIYAPRILFEDPLSGSTVSSSRSSLSIQDPDFKSLSFLPMMNAPWYESELKAIIDEEKIPRDNHERGDKEDFVLLPPMVRGYRTAEQLFTNFQEIKKYFKAKIETIKSHADRIQFFASYLKGRIADAAKEVNNLAFAESVTDGRLSSRGKENFLNLTGQSLENATDIGRDVQKAAREVGVTILRLVDNVMSKEALAVKKRVLDYKKDAEAQQDRVAEIRKIQTQWEENFKDLEKSWKDRVGVMAVKHHLPWGRIEDGTYTLDKETGILQTSEPLVVLDQPFFFDGDETEVIQDGAVVVTFGYELKEHNAKAYTNFLFVASDSGPQQVANPVAAGVSRASAIKAVPIRMNGRLYTLDAGTPVNLGLVSGEARQKAAEALGVPRATVGHVYEFSGFRNFPLDAGVSSVQHVWDGNLARTHLAVNAPNARMPLGPGRLADRRGSTLADIAEAVEERR